MTTLSPTPLTVESASAIAAEGTASSTTSAPETSPPSRPISWTSWPDARQSAARPPPTLPLPMTETFMPAPTTRAGSGFPLGGQRETLVATLCDLRTAAPEGPNASGVDHEDAGLAGDVRPRVPGVGLGKQRSGRALVRMLDPGVLRSDRRFDRGEVELVQVSDAVGRPLHVLLDRDDHVAQHRWA